MDAIMSRVPSVSDFELREQPVGMLEPGLAWDYELSQAGEVLFRLTYVLWLPEANLTSGRWHVKRHPEATWWRGTALDPPPAAHSRHGRLRSTRQRG